METTQVPYKKAKNPEEAYKKAAKVITPKYLEGMGVTAKVKFDEKNREIEAKGTGFTLSLSFDEKNTIVKLDLSFLLKPLKGKIIKTLESELHKEI